MAVATKEIRTVSVHNWNEFEVVKNDLAKEILKLKLVYDYIGNKGFTAEADSLLGEAVSNAEMYGNDIMLFFECVSDGLEYNPD